MTEQGRDIGHGRAGRTLNEEVRSLRTRLTRFERAKGEHDATAELYRAVVDNSAQGLAVIENGRIVFANRNMETLTGCSVEELRAMSAEQVRTLVHPEDQQLVWSRHRDRLAGDDPRNPCDFRVIHRDGTVRWLRLYANRIAYRGRDAVQAACVDISDWRQAEERQAHIKKVLLAIRSIDQLIVAETDRQKLIERACANLTETLGYFSAWIALLDKTGQSIAMTAASGFDGDFEAMRGRLERGEFPRCMTEALWEGTTVVVGGPKNDCPECPVAPVHGSRAGLARRLASSGKVYGVLVVSVPGPYADDLEEQDLFRELADDLGLALHRIEAAEALRDSEDRYRRFVEMALEGIWAMNPEHETTFVNERMASMLGYAPQQILGRKVEDFMFEEDLPAHRGRMQSRHQGKGGQYEHRFRRADGSEVWTLVSATAIVSEQGQFGGSFAMFTDITERKRAIRALERSEQRYRALFEGSPIGIGLAELDGHVLAANQAMEELLGYSVEQWEHLNLANLYEDPKDRVALIERVQRDGRVSNYPLRLKHKDGRPVDVLLSTSLIQSEGRALLQTMCVDITDRVRAQEELAEASRRLREAVRAGNVGLWDWDLATNRVQYSPEWKRQIGYDEHEITDSFEEWQSRVHPEDLAPTLARVHRAIADGSAEYFTEFRFRHKDGSYRWILAQSSVFCDEAGRPSRVLGSHIDITERKRMEEALRESEERLRLAHKATNDVVWDWDIVRDAQRWNPAGVTVFGWKDIVEAPQTAGWWVGRVHPEDRQRVDEGFFAVVNDPARNHWQDEYRFRRADGSYAEVLDRGYVMRNDEGEAVRMIGAMLDITERKRAEEALNRQRAELQAVYDHAPVMMCVLDADRRVLFANRAFTEFTGVSESHLRKGRACGVFGCINAKDDPRGCGFGPACQGCALRRALDVTLRTGIGHRNIEYRATIEHNTSRRAVLLIGATAAIHTGEQTNALLCLEDRTEQEQAEHQARQRELELLHVARLSTLGEMASGLAHELSQPLSAIVNYSTACAQLGAVDRPDLQRIVKNIHRITEQAERARDIMVRIRELAQRRRPRLASVDVNRVIANVLDLLSWQIRQKGIDLNPDLDDRLPAARADVVQVEQVLVNLTRNAIEAMEQTPLQHRRLTIRTGSGEGGAVRIEVSDTGVGIPRDEPDRIFDAFFTTKADGLGIGLSISRTIVEMHEGTLQAGRNAEGGSTFVVVLPRASKQDGPGPGGSGVGVRSAW